jgi:hypothetical protein
VVAATQRSVNHIITMSCNADGRRARGGKLGVTQAAS